jgi:TonB family protein
VTWTGEFTYPPAALRTEQEGVVRLRYTVAADGSVQQVQLARRSGYRHLDRDALFRAQNAQATPALGAQGQPISLRVEVAHVYRLDPPEESAADQALPHEDRVRRRVLRHYSAAAAWHAARDTPRTSGQPAVPVPPPKAVWPLGRRVVFTAEVMPDGRMQKIALHTPSGDETLDRVAYDAVLRTGSIPLAQPTDQAQTVLIELK